MVLGNQVEWALHCVSLLAALPAQTVAPAQVLADMYDLPKPYLAKSLQALAGAGLVDSVPGPRGGYRLAKAPADISFLDVVEAVEGKQNSFRCTEIRRQGPCAGPPRKGDPICAIAGTMWAADEAWRAVLRGRSMADLQGELAEVLQPEWQARAEAWLTPRLR